MGDILDTLKKSGTTLLKLLLKILQFVLTLLEKTIDVSQVLTDQGLQVSQSLATGVFDGLHAAKPEISQIILKSLTLISSILGSITFIGRISEYTLGHISDILNGILMKLKNFTGVGANTYINLVRSEYRIYLHQVLYNRYNYYRNIWCFPICFYKRNRICKKKFKELKQLIHNKSETVIFGDVERVGEADLKKMFEEATKKFLTDNSSFLEGYERKCKNDDNKEDKKEAFLDADTQSLDTKSLNPELLSMELASTIPEAIGAAEDHADAEAEAEAAEAKAEAAAKAAKMDGAGTKRRRKRKTTKRKRKTTKRKRKTKRKTRKNKLKHKKK